MKLEKIRIHYGENENQIGDLRLPAGNGPYPVVIVIHGGFWRAYAGLDRTDGIAEDLTRRGIATWNMEYRRVGQDGGGFPGTLIDVANAADHLYTLAKSYPLDLSRVVAVGHSAGGQLAMWLAGRHRLPSTSVLRTTDRPLPIHKVVSLAGVLDMALMEEVHHIREIRQKLVDNPVYDLLGGHPHEVPQHYEEASPIRLLPIGVKQVLVHGPLDIHVPIGISTNYMIEAKNHGDDVKLLEIPTAEHFKLVDPQSEAWPIIAEEIIKDLK